MTVLTSSLIVKLIDGITAPAKRAAESLRGIGRAAQGINGRNVGGTFADRMGAAAAANSARMDALRGKMLDATAIGFGLFRALSAPLDKAREFESVLLDIAQKGDMTDEAMKHLGSQIGTLAGKLQKSVSQLSLAKGVDVLAGFGLDNATALRLMEPISKAAVAYKAEVEDLAKASYSAIDNLKVPADQLAKALDVMAQSGKEGAFELKDMAQQFPVLTAAAKALQMTGIDGVSKLSAALQIARKGAATGAEAATNTANLMQKIISPETTKKFKKVGIDIRKELAKVQKEGGDVFEMISALVVKATKGDIGKLGDFFQDSEVQKFLRPLIENIGEYRKIRDKSKGANGVVDTDFERRLKTGEAALAQFKNRMEDLGRTIGAILLPTVNSLMGVIGALTDHVAGIAERFPGLTKALIVATSALIAFRVATIAAAYGGAFLKGAWLSLALASSKVATAFRAVAAAALLAPLTRIAGVLQIVALRFRLAAAAGLAFNATLLVGTLATFSRALVGLLRPLALVAAALRVLKVAMIATGWGAALVGLAAAGTWIYKNWSNIGAAFKAFGGAYMREIRPILNDPAVKSFVGIAETIANAFAKLTGEGKTADFQTFGQGLAKTLGQATIKVVGLKDSLLELFGIVRGGPTGPIGGGFDWLSLFDTADGGDWIGTLATKARTALKALPMAIAVAIGEAIGQGQAKAAELWPKVVESVVAGARDLPAKAAAALSGLGEVLSAKLAEAWSAMTSGSSGMTGGIEGAFSSALAKVGELGGALAQALQAIGASMQSTGREIFSSLGTAITTGIDAALASASAKIAEIGSTLVAGLASAGEQLRAAGASAMKALLDGMTSVGESIVAWASGLAGRIVAPFTGLPGRLRSLMGGGGGAPAGGGGGGSSPAPTAPARAEGGHVAAGKVYQVNDGGGRDPVELFRPERSGVINTAAQRRQAASGGSGGGGAASAQSGPVTLNATFNITGATSDPKAIAREVMGEMNHEIRKLKRGLFADIGMRTV